MEHPTSPTELYAQAMKLSVGERAALAVLLLESLEPDTDDGVDAAWREEIERRIYELDQGTVTPVAWEQVRARLHGAA